MIVVQKKKINFEIKRIIQSKTVQKFRREIGTIFTRPEPWTFRFILYKKKMASFS